ncbi:MAG: PPC domain-containing protein [Anaerolineae bacterium]|nr:PPC domain-containing protein [Anaerolineae bacterium]
MKTPCRRLTAFLSLLLIVGLLSSWVVSGSLYAQDGIQLVPNQIVTGTIDTPGQENEYFYDGTGGTDIEIEVQAAAGSQLVPSVAIVDIDGNILASEARSGGAVIAITLPATSTYRVLVGGSGDSIGDYQLELRVEETATNTPSGPAQMPTSTLNFPTPTPEGTFAPTRIPPGVSRTGRPIELNTTVEGYLAVGRWDVWQFDAEAGQVVTIELTSTDFDPYLELYEPSDTPVPFIADDDGGRGTNSLIYNTQLLVSGTYQIYVHSFEDSSSGAYALSLFEGTGTVVSVENSTLLSFGETVIGTLTTPEAAYYFEGTAGQQVSLFLTSTQFDTYLELLDAEGTLVGENDDDGRTTNSALNLELPDDGIYFVLVSAYETQIAGEFELELYPLDSIESPGGALDIGQTAKARLLPKTAAIWTFQATAGQIVSVSAMPQNPTEQLDLFVDLMDADGRVLISDDDSGLGLSPQITDYPLPITGEYAVRVREASATIGGRYLLALAEGRVYFSPLGVPAEVVVLQDGTAWTAGAMDDTIQTYALWVIPVIEGQALNIQTLTAVEGSNFPGDFEMRLFDTDWDLAAESVNGVLDLQRIQPPSDYLLLVHFRGIGEQPYQLVFTTSQ